jgi:hypothetical protein
MTIEADGSLKKPIVTQWELIPFPAVCGTTTVRPVTSISSRNSKPCNPGRFVDADETLVKGQRFRGLAG